MKILHSINHFHVKYAQERYGKKYVVLPRLLLGLLGNRITDGSFFLVFIIIVVVVLCFYVALAGPQLHM